MNDYERLMADLDEALSVAESIDSVDPDIEAVIGEGIAKLRQAAEMAEDRV